METVIRKLFEDNASLLSWGKNIIVKNRTCYKVLYYAYTLLHYKLLFNAVID